MEIQPLDIVVAAIVAAAMLRGYFIGLVREAFSLGALGGAYLAVQLFTLPSADWLQEVSNGNVGPSIAPWLAGAGLAIGTIAIVIIVGRGLKRTLKAAGLNWADRFGGGLLGAAEGAQGEALAHEPDEETAQQGGCNHRKDHDVERLDLHRRPPL